MPDGSKLPVTVLNGRPGYINFLDALNSWQLVKELKEATGLPAAASFKHVSPAGAAVGLPLTETDRRDLFCPGGRRAQPHRLRLYPRPRRGPPLLLRRLGRAQRGLRRCDSRVSQAGGLRRHHRPGLYAGGACDPARQEKGQLQYRTDGSRLRPRGAGVQACVRRHASSRGATMPTLTNASSTNIVTENQTCPGIAKRDLLIATITLKYTQSNSVCYAYDGQAIGIGAGQQSRVHCTRLAGDKADRWFLRQSPQVLGLPFKDDVRRPDRDNAIDVYIGSEWRDLLETDDWKRVFTEKPPVFTEEEKRAWLQKVRGVSLGSDAFFPFGDNIERAHKSGVTYVAQTGGSIRDDNVIETADKYGMTMAMTHIRLFHH